MTGFEGTQKDAGMNIPVPLELEHFLHAADLLEQGRGGAAQAFRAVPMTGGVSSDIWLIEHGNAKFVVKRALPRLKVEGAWEVTVERSRYEYLWLSTVARLVPGSAPTVLGYDEATGFIAMRYYEPDLHPTWKSHLLRGVAHPRTPTDVGHALGQIHAATSREKDLAMMFDRDDIFEAVRIAPYLRAVAKVHPVLAEPIDNLIAGLLAHRGVVIHGDMSPKNILVGPSGPLFLDAECAWWGDPAFDLAFCLTHLALKRLVNTARHAPLRRWAEQFTDAYARRVTWEDPGSVLERTATLLPALMLARVDGLSPVEYLDQQAADLVRRFAPRMILRPERNLCVVHSEWDKAVA